LHIGSLGEVKDVTGRLVPRAPWYLHSKGIATLKKNSEEIEASRAEWGVKSELNEKVDERSLHVGQPLALPHVVSHPLTHTPFILSIAC
jgi:hypothetical protein